MLITEIFQKGKMTLMTFHLTFLPQSFSPTFHIYAIFFFFFFFLWNNYSYISSDIHFSFPLWCFIFPLFLITSLLETFIFLHYIYTYFLIHWLHIYYRDSLRGHCFSSIDYFHFHFRIFSHFSAYFPHTLLSLLGWCTFHHWFHSWESVSFSVHCFSLETFRDYR